MMPNEVSKLTLIAAVSVAQTMREATGLDCLIKWPNDILVGRDKICGILTELKAEQDATSFVILGIGINVNTKPSALPRHATSVFRETEENISRIHLLRMLLENIENHYILFKNNSFNAIIDEWKNLSAVLGKRIRIAVRSGTIEGQAVDIDSGGALVVRLDSGLLERVLAGDVMLVR
jgi:BirA family biotin operon repressor/biotin-[acetyl-CoA-carboxylase] ligase